MARRSISPHSRMILGGVNVRGFARAGFDGPYARRGGTVSLWAGSLSAVVPSVSSHRQNCIHRENTCGLSPFRACSIVSSRRLCFARDASRARFLIKNDRIPFALQERTSQSNVNRSDLSVARGAVRIKSSPVLAIRIRFGRTLWKSLHGLADGWPCARCRPQMIVWMQGLHDAVNVRLGKPPFRPDAYAQYASGLLERGFHAGCFGCRVARAGSRVLARAPRPQIWSR